MSIISILKKKNNKTLFTTPSHGGKFCIFHKFYQWYKNDISEVDAYMPQEAVLNAEKEASAIYKTKYTKFLTNGSTSGIIAAILASKPKNILIWENAHPCHLNGAKLSSAKIIKYSIPFDEELGLHKAIPTKLAEELIVKHRPDTFVITTPTYEGFAANVKDISKFCKKNNVTLIVDEAHGALYPFSNNLPESAVNHADFIVQSLHKTAGGINPTALLHSNNIDPTEALEMISTTSPSYPMLATIEANIKYLNSVRGRKHIELLIDSIKKLGIEQLNNDPTKILLKGGKKLSDKLYNIYNIEDERTNDKTCLLLCGIGTDIKRIDKLKKVLTHL